MLKQKYGEVFKFEVNLVFELEHLKLKYDEMCLFYQWLKSSWLEVWIVCTKARKMCWVVLGQISLYVCVL